MNFRGKEIGLKEIFSKFRQLLHTTPWCVVANFLVLYFCYMICRLVFLVVNIDMFASGLYPGLIWRIVKGGLLYDTSAIFSTNLLYLLLVFIPWHRKEIPIVEKITKWLFIVVNVICLLSNLVDSVYFAFSEKRATVLMYNEFAGNTNGGTVVGKELVNQWPLVIMGIVLILIVVVCYRSAKWDFGTMTKRRYYVRQTMCLVVFSLLSVFGIQGNALPMYERPVSMVDAFRYTDTPTQTAIVVNTPFSVIRSAFKHSPTVPEYYGSEAEIEQYYTAVHLPGDSVTPDKRNVVIFIVESFAEEFIGARNRDLDDGQYKGYTEFIDSLLPHCLTFEHTYANGWISVDAMPSVLSSVPKMYVPFVLSPYAYDDTPGLARELGGWGYASSFFHGAENTSMGFQAFAHASGFQNYYGRTEYESDPRTGGTDDFDGTWAIWDEEFLQWMCLKIDEMPQPFLASVFTATSHHPFEIPARYKERFSGESTYPIDKCIRYTDNALRMFFAAAKRQPWYDNTIFVITADHASSRVTHELYRTSEGDFRVPILFYDPSGKIGKGNLPGIAQQIDIMPTLLGMLGYDKPYVAFGKDMLRTKADDTWAFSWHNVPQYIKGDYLLQYNDNEISGIYNLRTDRMMKYNLVGSDDYDKAYVDRMVHEIQAIMQEENRRLRDNKLLYK